MKTYLKAFGLGVLQVTLVAANTRQAAQLHYGGAFLVGTMISLVWAFNVRSIATSDRWAGVAYALGAGVGTVLGMWLTKLYYGV